MILNPQQPLDMTVQVSKIEGSIMNSMKRRIIALISVSMLISACSAEDSSEFNRDRNDEFTTDPTTPPDQGVGIVGHHDGLGNGDDEAPGLSTCLSYAIPSNVSYEEILADPSRTDWVCFDSLRIDENACGQAEMLTNMIKNNPASSEDQVTCVDQDNDCYYVCGDWQLSVSLADPDDRRNTVPGDRTEEDGTAIAGMESGACINLSDDGNVGTIVEGTVCTYHNHDQTFKPMWPCENDGFAWVSSEDEGLALNLNYLSESSESMMTLVSMPIDFIPAELSCHRGISGGWSVIFTDPSRGEIYRYVERSLLPYETPLQVETLIDSGLELSAIDSLSMDSTAFQSWRYHLEDSQDPSGASAILGMRVGNDVVHYDELPSGVIDHQVSCNGCDPNMPLPRYAYLRDDQSVVISQTFAGVELPEEIKLFESYGPFEVINSSESLLGLAKSNESNEELYFSLWSEPLLDDDSLINFPLIFNARDRGYESAQLMDIKGMNVLINLRSANMEAEDLAEAKQSFAVYNALTDQVFDLEEVFNKNTLISMQLIPDDGETEVVWDKPQLHDTWVSRVARVSLNQYLLIVKINQ